MITKTFLSRFRIYMVGATNRNARIFCRNVVSTAAATPSMIAMLWIPVQARMISTLNVFLEMIFQSARETW